MVAGGRLVLSGAPDGDASTGNDLGLDLIVTDALGLVRTNIARPDHLSDFPVSTLNKFGDTFSQGPFDMPDGGKVTYDHAVSGRIGRTAASGTYAVTLKLTDAAGAPSDTCTLPRLRWKAAS